MFRKKLIGGIDSHRQASGNLLSEHKRARGGVSVGLADRGGDASPGSSKKRDYLFICSMVMFFCCAFFLHAGYANESGCIKCHTNEQTLEALHKPVKIDTPEGEG